MHSFYTKEHIRILRKDDGGEEYFLNENEEWKSQHYRVQYKTGI
jgi:hypothetical protein